MPVPDVVDCWLAYQRHSIAGPFLQMQSLASHQNTEDMQENEPDKKMKKEHCTSGKMQLCVMCLYKNRAPYS